jgi:hypothetical protein
LVFPPMLCQGVFFFAPDFRERTSIRNFHPPPRQKTCYR